VRRIAQCLGLERAAVRGDNQLRRTTEQTIDVCPIGHVTIGNDESDDHARTSV
jgi:hypothetical protein